MDHLISIVVPIYNACEYLHRCLNSIVSRMYAHLEIILVNDGSTDGSDQICAEFAQKDGRIPVIHQENSGIVNKYTNGAFV